MNRYTYEKKIGLELKESRKKLVEGTGKEFLKKPIDFIRVKKLGITCSGTKEVTY